MDANPEQTAPSPPRRPWRPLRVAAWAVGLALAAVGLYAASPWLLPISIVEGPMVQLAGEHSARVVYYTTRGGDTRLEYTVAGQKREAAIQRDGWRCDAALVDLPPGSAVPYRISGEGRTLADETLHTARPADAPFSFIVFGDSGRGTREQFVLARRMAPLEPDLVVHTGDLIYPGGERRHFRERFFRPYADLLARVGFWPSLGNHDVGKPDFGAPYREVFDLPENGPEGLTPEDNYWFDYAGARFVIVDSNLDEATLRERVSPWLTRTFEGWSGWRFVVFHHPPYTCGKYGPDPGITRGLLPAIEAANVDVVFNGHDHLYERTYPLRKGKVVPTGEGTTYIVSGSGGAKLYAAKPPEERPPYIATLNDRVHSFTHVEIEGDALRARQIDLNGNVLDEWTATRRSPRSAQRRPARRARRMIGVAP